MTLAQFVPFLPEIFLAVAGFVVLLLGIPLGRMAEPADVCDLVLFLLSDRARHITMENIVIDGGATLGAR